MRIREQIWEDMQDLSSDELNAVYSCVRAFKHRHNEKQEKAPPIDEVRQALRSSKSNWAKDITQNREERA